MIEKVSPEIFESLKTYVNNSPLLRKIGFSNPTLYALRILRKDCSGHSLGFSLHTEQKKILQSNTVTPLIVIPAKNFSG